MTRHSQNELRYKQMYLINKFEKEILENSLSKMGEQKNTSNEISTPNRIISEATQTDDSNKMTETLKDKSNLSGIESNDVNESTLSDVDGYTPENITIDEKDKTDDLTTSQKNAKSKSTKKNKKILNNKSKHFDTIKRVTKLRSGKRYNPNASNIQIHSQSTPKTKNKHTLQDDDINFYGWKL